MSAVAESPKSPTPTQSDGSVLPFPDRFYKAVSYVTSLPEDTTLLTDEHRLMLYALHQQAEKGKCNEPKPWSWNVVESAKWNSWNQLGDMAGVEAMRLYVKFLETEIKSDWWIEARSAELQNSRKRPDGGPAAVINSIQTLVRSMTVGEWTEIRITGARLPPPRYEHAIAVVNRTLYVIGGNCNGRYLNDVWSLDLESLKWSQVEYTAAPREAVGGGEQVEPSSQQEADSQPPALPQLAGHALVVWGTTILCIGGHTKSKGPGQIMVVRAFNTETRVWSILTVKGSAPPNRGSHTATLIGNSIYVFGGEEKSRRTVNDVYALNLTSMAWEYPEKVGKGPAPRSGHAAVALSDAHLLIFGGGSVAQCFGDLWVLSVESWSWTQITPTGRAPSARAGHSAALLASEWYIAGGGDNKAGCTDVWSLDVGSAQQTEGSFSDFSWREVAQVAPGSSIVSEGMGMVGVERERLLLTFGGYNGKYQNTVHAFRKDSSTPADAHEESKVLKPEAKPPKPQASGSGFKQAASSAPKEQTPEDELRARSNQAVLQNGTSAAQAGQPRESLTRMASLEGVARDAQAARDAMQSEVGLMRKQLNAALQAKAAVEKEVDQLKEELRNEQEKSLKLEVTLAEARQKLSTVKDLENQLGKYRKLLEEAEQKGKSKAGLWTYISGTDK